MPSKYQKGDKLICPKCQKPNDLNAEYCWACYFDFIPNEPSALPVRENHPRPQKPNTGRNFFLNLVFFLPFAVLSTGIIYGSWFLFHWLYPARPIWMFVLAWIGLILLAWYSEGQLPEVETDWTQYWSLNPFNFEDDRNRFYLMWHITLFIPKIVLFTIKTFFRLFSKE